MNREKWLRSPEVRKLVAHVAEVLPPELTALVACELAEHALAAFGEEDQSIVRGAQARVRAWALGGQRPELRESAALDDDGPWPNARALSAGLLLLPHRPAHAGELADHVASALGEPDASELLADTLRELVPYLNAPELRFERLAPDRIITDSLEWRVEGGRLVSSTLSRPSS